MIDEVNFHKTPAAIVSLTTLPSRFEHVRPTLDSLCSQTKVPDKILICVPNYSAREKCIYIEPEWLEEYRPLVEVVKCGEDYGPGTKLLGCIRQLPPDGCLIIADDDMVYKNFFVEHLFKNITNSINRSFSFYTYQYERFIVGQGADGFCFMVKDLKGVFEFGIRAIKNEKLRIVDDLWISAFLMRQGIEICSLKDDIPNGELVYEPVHEVNQLHHVSGSFSRSLAMREGGRYLLESGLMGRGQQTVALVKKIGRVMLHK